MTSLTPREQLAALALGCWAVVVAAVLAWWWP